LSWGTWWAIPAFLLYGAIYNVPAVSKWHEFSHGTPFKTPWMNEFMYQVTSFMVLVQPTLFRWSHTRHHSDTIIIGRDREFTAMRPSNWYKFLCNFIRLNELRLLLPEIIGRSLGRISEEEKVYIPQTEYKKLFWEARVWLLIMIGIVALCIYTKSILPLLLIGLPSFYGQPFNYFLNITQHGGLSEDVLDHRLNTRTFYANPILRFLYSNMNYHVEHHMFPSVPYYNLPALHEVIKHDCPPAYQSVGVAFKEAITAIYRQRKTPEYTPVRPLPDSARPYKYQ
jgi:fatty acid desaturase